jgi:hypothetical protein
VEFDGNCVVERETELKYFFLITIYLQDVKIQSANGAKLLETRRGVLSSTLPYK